MPGRIAFKRSYLYVLLPLARFLYSDFSRATSYPSYLVVQNVFLKTLLCELLSWMTWRALKFFQNLGPWELALIHLLYIEITNFYWSPLLTISQTAFAYLQWQLLLLVLLPALFEGTRRGVYALKAVIESLSVDNYGISQDIPSSENQIASSHHSSGSGGDHQYPSTGDHANDCRCALHHRRENRSFASETPTRASGSRRSPSSVEMLPNMVVVPSRTRSGTVFNTRRLPEPIHLSF